MGRLLKLTVNIIKGSRKKSSSTSGPITKRKGGGPLICICVYLLVCVFVFVNLCVRCESTGLCVSIYIFGSLCRFVFISRFFMDNFVTVFVQICWERSPM